LIFIIFRKEYLIDIINKKMAVAFRCSDNCDSIEHNVEDEETGKHNKNDGRGKQGDFTIGGQITRILDGSHHVSEDHTLGYALVT
jgi:hypothetical protein